MESNLFSRVDATRLRSLVAAAALVGLVAGLIGATFAFVAGEPAVDDAIAIEEAAAAEEPHDEEGDEGHDAEVSRTHQRGIGLFTGYAITGAVFGAFLAVTAYGLRHGRPDAGRRVLMAGVILASGFTFAPWIKYPPNPPAVGDPDTLAKRQLLYVSLICITIAVGIAATILSRRLRAGGLGDVQRIVAVAGSVIVAMLVIFAVMPPAPDEIGVPAELVWRFRLASLGANFLLWSVLTLGLAWVVSSSAAVETEDQNSMPLRAGTPAS